MQIGKAIRAASDGAEAVDNLGAIELRDLPVGYAETAKLFHIVGQLGVVGGDVT